MTATHVLVGVGGGPEGRRALDWAAREASSRHCDLRLLRAYHWDSQLLPWETPGDRTIGAAFRHAAETHLRDAIAHVRSTFPDVPVIGTTVDDLAWTVLNEWSGRAVLTVVGARHHTALGSALAGSTSTFVAAGAQGPVVVVRGTVPGPDAIDEGPAPAVVVGLDGSPVDHDTLAFAFEVADRRHRPVHAVYCARPRLGHELDGAAGQRWVAEQVAGWREKYPDVEVVEEVVGDHPVAGLCAVAHRQELLVVGARIRHARVGIWLGSTSQGVLHHAPCPVAVVHQHPSEVTS
ncbi:MAG: universal stress protein [Jatrophihabitans sp.]|uniref:universal stress protein n=1 Tax=Jatrophihabitans sp. TaxID=1932789 RepID=UPI003F81BFB1